MSKDQTVTRSSHVFSLTRLRAECHYASVTVDFTPPPRYLVHLMKCKQSFEFHYTCVSN